MWSPFVMLLVLAGLVSVPKYLYEAAAIDRVSRWRQFWSITFPYIRGLMLLALLFRTIEAFKLFDLVFLLTNGGPGTATETIALRVYRIAFENNKTSESTALAYILLFTVIVLTNLYLYFANSARRRRRFMTDMLRTSPCRVALGRARAARASDSLRAIGLGRRRRRLGPNRRRRHRQLHLLLPGALDHPHSVQNLRGRARRAGEILFHPDAENFAQVFSRAYSAGGQAQNTGFTLYFFNSLFISGVSVLLALLIGTLAAFGFSRYPLKGNDTYLFMILTTRMLPAIVVIIPIFIMFRVTGLAGTYMGIIALYTTFNLPFAIWMMKSFFDEFSPDVEDAARIDGSSDVRVFFKICLPQVLAGLAATAVFGLILTWNEFLFALLLRAWKRGPSRSPCRRRSVATSASGGVSWPRSRRCSSFRSSS